LRLQVWDHIRENGREKGIFVDFVNGYSDHCHALISMKPTQSMASVMHLLKGESAYWINKNKLTEMKFEWQDEYYGVSVSNSIVPKVRGYIKKQEKHHAKTTVKEEIKEFVRVYRFEDITLMD
jgi:REP element-mobilizing transposase RayT